MNSGAAVKRLKRYAYAVGGGVLVAVASWLALQQLALYQVSDRQLDLLAQSASSAAALSSRTRGSLQHLADELDLPARGPRCDAALQRTLHWVHLSIPGARGALRVQDGVVTCSSTRALPAGSVLPATSFRHDDAIHAWHDVPLPGMEAVGPHLVLERHQLALLLHPHEQFTQFFRPGTPVAVYRARPPHTAALMPAPIAASLLSGLPDGVDAQRGRDAHTGDLVVRQRTPSNQAIVMAIVPAAEVQALVTRQFHRLRWLAPLAGVLATLLLLWRLRPGYRSARRELLHAIDRDQLYLLYQPVIDLQSGRCIGAEALMRWEQSDGGMLGPDVFVPLAEQSGLSHRLTERACQLIGQQIPAVLAVLPTFRIGLNISALELHTDEIVTKLTALRSRLRLPPAQLVVELTESSLADADLAVPVITRLRNSGIAVAIDDFGTGYCSLSYLATYPFDILKIDRSFVNAAGTDSVIGPIAQHIVTLARSMGVDSLAEGIETPQQAETFRALGVTYAQGYHFGAAMRIDQLLQLIAKDAREGR